MSSDVVQLLIPPPQLRPAWCLPCSQPAVCVAPEPSAARFRTEENTAAMKSAHTLSGSSGSQYLGSTRLLCWDEACSDQAGETLWEKNGGRGMLQGLCADHMGRPEDGNRRGAEEWREERRRCRGSRSASTMRGCRPWGGARRSGAGHLEQASRARPPSGAGPRITACTVPQARWHRREGTEVEASL